MRHRVIEEDLRDITSRDLPWEALRGTTVLVTGAYGFINAYLVETLLFLNEIRPGFGLRVLALARNREKAARRFSHYLDRRDLAWHYQDVCQPLHPGEPVHYVVHGASWASPKFYGEYPVDVLLPNVFGTRHLLDLARAEECKGFLMLSSAENYGDVAPEQIPIKESTMGNVDPISVRSCYAESKRMAETMCVSWRHQYGVPAVIARIFHTYGPGMALDDGRVFADFVADIVAGRDIRMKSDGSAVRAFCYLADAAEGLFRILLQGERGQPYNLGNESAACSVLELAQTLVGLFPERHLNVQRAKEEREAYLKSHIHRTLPDTGRLRGLGWQPRYGVREGFRRTVLSYL